MHDSEYKPVAHVHEEFLNKALKRKGFRTAYNEHDEEYALLRELLMARFMAGMTQEQVAEAMGTTKSAVSRMESISGHSPSVATLRKYAHAVGGKVEIRIVSSGTGKSYTIKTEEKKRPDTTKVE
ncbi:MAG: helix-turn-helix transcriptional regulator [Bacteroidota bacterium]